MNTCITPYWHVSATSTTLGYERGETWGIIYIEKFQLKKFSHFGRQSFRRNRLLFAVNNV